MNEITIDDQTKIRIARIGPVRTFGDFDARQKLDESQLLALFNDKWEVGLERAVSNSLPCECEVAKSRLQGRQAEFIDPTQKIRQFRFQSMDFIAQLKPKEDRLELTQLWKVQSGDDHPKTIFVTCDSVIERKRFKEIADHLVMQDEDLALQIIQEFVTKFDKIIPPKGS